MWGKVERLCLFSLFYSYLRELNGAPTRTRTADLLITNQLLYQLSYRGTEGSFRESRGRVQEGNRSILSDFTRAR